MSYNNGIDFGYDQIFVNPGINHYFEDKPAMCKNNIEKDLLKKIRNMENSDNVASMASAGSSASMASMASMALLDKPCSSCKNNQVIMDIERERLRQSLVDMQRKNDMLTMFIVFLVVYVIMQYNTFNQGIYYANTLSMTRPGSSLNNPTT